MSAIRPLKRGPYRFYQTIVDNFLPYAKTLVFTKVADFCENCGKNSF